MEESIRAVKEMIGYQIENRGIVAQRAFNKYCKTYASTNENIFGYLNKLNMQDKNEVLTVMSSGDHLLNVACYGIKNIDTFDFNMLTKYYALGIKVSAILTFNYKQYIRYMNKLFFTKNIDEMSDLIKLIMPSMDKKYRIYWNELIDYNYKLQKEYNTKLNLFQMILLDVQKLDLNSNYYLLNEGNYNKLRRIIGRVNINFKCCECTQLPYFYQNRYDLILLSNILDYLYGNINYGYGWNYKKLVNFEHEFDKLLTNDGQIALNYIFDYNVLKTLINYSNIYEKDLKNEKIITFPSVQEKSFSKSETSAILLYKK